MPPHKPDHASFANAISKGAATIFARCRFVLSHPSHPGNIGAAARAIKTMGFERLELVAPKRFPDPQATALASGAEDVLTGAGVHQSLSDALKGATLVAGLSARRRDLSHRQFDAREAARLLTSEEAPVLVFGNEMSGLSNRELELCQMLVTIPANPAYASLNLAAAVQVLAYEMRMAAVQPASSVPTEAQYARHEDIEQFYAHLEQVMIETGFLDPARPKRLMPRLRRLFSRTRLEHEEVNILRGVLRATQRR